MVTLFNLDKSSISNFSKGSWRQTSVFDTTDSRPAESMTITVSEPRLPFTEPSVQLPQGSLVQIFIFPWSRTVNLMARPDMLCPRPSHVYQPLMLCCIWVHALSTKQQRGKAWANKSPIKTACTQIRNLTTDACAAAALGRRAKGVVPDSEFRGGVLTIRFTQPGKAGISPVLFR